MAIIASPNGIARFSASERSDRESLLRGDTIVGSHKTVDLFEEMRTSTVGRLWHVGCTMVGNDLDRPKLNDSGAVRIFGIEGSR